VLGVIEIALAFISGLTALVVAVIERRTRKDEEKWDQNTRDHDALVQRVESIGGSLGRSLDRVEDNIAHHIIRLENKVERHDQVLFDHLAHHAELEVNARSRKKQKTEVTE
jgi:cell division protein FtsB